MKRFGYKKIEPAELSLLDVGLFVVEHYINDRKYRRSLKDTRLDDKIKSVINRWKTKER